MKLLEFSHSHFCEKARWALDFKGVSFESVAILPLFHLLTVRRYAPSSSVPVLLTGENAVQGSDQIISYLDETYPARPLRPENDDAYRECLKIEHDMEHRLGENLRTILYHWLLPYPDFICQCFTGTMPRYKAGMFRLMYPFLRKKMYQFYVVSVAEVERARSEFDRAVADVEEVIGKKEYLVGDQFSRADLSVASLLSLLVLPEEHPFPCGEIPCPHTQGFIGSYSGRPIAAWVRKMYRLHRSHVG